MKSEGAKLTEATLLVCGRPDLNSVLPLGNLYRLQVESAVEPWGVIVEVCGEQIKTSLRQEQGSRLYNQHFLRS